MAFYFEIIISQKIAKKSTGRPTNPASPNGVLLHALVQYQNQEINNDT